MKNIGINIIYLKKKINLPSNFAKFIKKKFLKKKDIVLDVATGNGRDSFFLRKHIKFVYGIDKSKSSHRCK